MVALVGVALAAGVKQYGGTTSQKSGGAALGVSLVVGHGAVSNIQLQAFVKAGGGACSVNVSPTSFAFTKGKLKINGQSKFGGRLKDATGDSVTISGRFKNSKVAGSFTVNRPVVPPDRRPAVRATSSTRRNAPAGRPGAPPTAAPPARGTPSISASQQTANRSTASSSRTRRPAPLELVTRLRSSTSAPSRSEPAGFPAPRSTISGRRSPRHFRSAARSSVGPRRARCPTPR